MVALALHQAERGLQVPRDEADRGRRDHALGQEFVRDQDRAAIERAEIFRVEQAMS